MKVEGAEGLGPEQVAEELRKAEVDIGEDEYALLLGVARHGAPWAKCLELFDHMTRELTALHPTTVALAEALFLCAPHPTDLHVTRISHVHCGSFPGSLPVRSSETSPFVMSSV